MTKILLIAAAALLFVAANGIVQATNLDSRIVGGESISTLYVPHQVSLRRRSVKGKAYAHSCGGSVLDEYTIITAAHCVYKREAKDFLVVAGGEYRAGSDGVVARVQQLLPHELYNASITDNDIALVLLSTPLPLKHNKIAAIELTAIAPAAGTVASVSGWGLTTEGGLGAAQLQQVEVPLVSAAECQAAYNWRPITVAMLCAGDQQRGGRDACNGDSGGPLVVNKQLAGLVSWGEGCARVGFPGVYTNVAQFLDWIAEQRVRHV